LFRPVPQISEEVFREMTTFIGDAEALKEIRLVSTEQQAFTNPRMKFVPQTPADFDRLTSGESTVDRQTVLSLKLSFKPTLHPIRALSQLPNLTSLDLSDDRIRIGAAGAASLSAAGVLPRV
jgi:hypothetical protein